jgi:hypothetical protein
VGTRCADHVTPLYPQKLALTSPTGGGRSVGIVGSRTKATEFSLVFREAGCCVLSLEDNPGIVGVTGETNKVLSQNIQSAAKVLIWALLHTKQWLHHLGCFCVPIVIIMCCKAC